MTKEIELKLKRYISLDDIINLKYLVTSSDWEIKINPNDNIEIQCRLVENDKLLQLVRLLRDSIKISIKASTDGHVIIVLI